MSLSAPGEDPLLFDLGTGLRYFGAAHRHDDPFRGSCLLTHLHWDHIQGVPFFVPLLRYGARLDVYAPPPSPDESVAQVVERTFTPPVFPVELGMLPGEVVCHDVDDSSFRIGGYQVTSRLVPHVGPTCGFRVEWNGRSVTYLSDHQQPIDGSFGITDGALELCRDVDVLIHDAQYTAAEFVEKATWGHSTIEYAVAVAVTAGATTLVLFHHDPTHDDAMIDRLAAAAASCGRADGVEVVAAHEGMVITLDA